MEHKVQFGTLQPDGKLTNVRYLKQSSMAKFPFFIMVPEHYRQDETCKCNDPEHRKMMMKEWGYKRSDFAKHGLLKKGE